MVHEHDSTLDNSSADPYLNTDAGTMSPFEHGEVFVLDDGGEVGPSACDLQLHLGPLLAWQASFQQHEQPSLDDFGRL